MLTREIAREQIEDRVRAASMARSARMVRGRRVRDPRSATRSAASGILAAIASVQRTVSSAPRTRPTTV